MRSNTILVILLTLCTAATSVLGDEVIFRNGDKLTGKIITADGGKLTIKTAVAGEVKVDLKDVKTFTTDQPIELQFPDGSTIKDRVKAAQDGSIATEGAGNVQPQRVELASVKRINPPPVKWAGTVTVGGLLTRGNSDTDNLNAALDTVRRSEQDRITFGAQYLYAFTADSVPLATARPRPPTTGISWASTTTSSQRSSTVTLGCAWRRTASPSWICASRRASASATSGWSARTSISLLKPA